VGGWHYEGSPYLEGSPTAHKIESSRAVMLRTNPLRPLAEIVVAAHLHPPPTCPPHEREPWVSDKPVPPYRDPTIHRRG
jgi:hypothetical protein